jgi:hypothetical protein
MVFNAFGFLHRSESVTFSQAPIHRDVYSDLSFLSRLHHPPLACQGNLVPRNLGTNCPTHKLQSTSLLPHHHQETCSYLLCFRPSLSTHNTPDAGVLTSQTTWFLDGLSGRGGPGQKHQEAIVNWYNCLWQPWPRCLYIGTFIVSRRKVQNWSLQNAVMHQHAWGRGTGLLRKHWTKLFSSHPQGNISRVRFLYEMSGACNLWEDSVDSNFIGNAKQMTESLLRKFKRNSHLEREDHCVFTLVWTSLLCLLARFKVWKSPLHVLTFTSGMEETWF